MENKESLKTAMENTKTIKLLCLLAYHYYASSRYYPILPMTPTTAKFWHGCQLQKSRERWSTSIQLSWRYRVPASQVNWDRDRQLNRGSRLSQGIVIQLISVLVLKQGGCVAFVHHPKLTAAYTHWAWPAADCKQMQIMAVLICLCQNRLATVFDSSCFELAQRYDCNRFVLSCFVCWLKYGQENTQESFSNAKHFTPPRQNTNRMIDSNLTQESQFRHFYPKHFTVWVTIKSVRLNFTRSPANSVINANMW